MDGVDAQVLPARSHGWQARIYSLPRRPLDRRQGNVAPGGSALDLRIVSGVCIAYRGCMKTRTFLLLLVPVWLALPVLAAEPDPSVSGWTPLFDGRTLAGWNHWSTRAPLEAGAWQAKDGILRLTGKGGGDIYTAAAYENYELSLEWKTTGNSGILLRVDPSHQGKIWNKAPELQINNDDPSSTGSTSAGGVYQLYGFEEPKVFDPDGWNAVRVRCRDGRFTVWLNGQQTADFQVGSKDWKERVAKSKFAKFSGFGELTRGHIGLQDHGAPVDFRNLKIREL